MPSSYKKITKSNGFDSKDLNNGRQNNYAWSMEELGEYLYVGTARNFVNIIQNKLSKFDLNSLDLTSFGIDSLNFNFIDLRPSDITLPKEFVSKEINMGGEIWRYKKDGSCPWERVYQASDASGIAGFRSMLTYTTPRGEKALYACCYNLNLHVLLLKTIDGINWTIIETGIDTGNSSRSMIIHDNKMFISVVNELSTDLTTFIYCSEDPENEPWTSITPSEVYNSPRGQAVSLCSFNNHLYAATALPYGFEVWRAENIEPEKHRWKCIVDKGAGDASNVIPLTMTVFKDYLYIGTAMHIVRDENINITNLPFRGFDLIRVDKKDNWQLVIGSSPLISSTPTTGKRTNPLSGLYSGFGQIANALCWQLEEFNDELYLATFDWSSLAEPLYAALLDNRTKLEKLPENKTLKFLLNNQLIIKLFIKAQKNTYGFDLWKSKDGIHWNPVNINGFGNFHNNGIRTLFVSSEGALYIGTSNLFEGCEVWIKE